MKFQFRILLYVILLASNLFADDYNLPKKVKVISKDLSLKEAKGDKRAFIAEYIPLGETFDNWTSMFAVRFVNGENLDPQSSAQNTHKSIQANRASYLKEITREDLPLPDLN